MRTFAWKLRLALGRPPACANAHLGFVHAAWKRHGIDDGPPVAAAVAAAVAAVTAGDGDEAADDDDDKADGVAAVAAAAVPVAAEAAGPAVIVAVGVVADTAATAGSVHAGGCSCVKQHWRLVQRAWKRHGTAGCAYGQRAPAVQCGKKAHGVAAVVDAEDAAAEAAAEEGVVADAEAASAIATSPDEDDEDEGTDTAEGVEDAAGAAATRSGRRHTIERPLDAAPDGTDGDDEVDEVETSPVFVADAFELGVRVEFALVEFAVAIVVAIAGCAPKPTAARR